VKMFHDVLRVITSLKEFEQSPKRVTPSTNSFHKTEKANAMKKSTKNVEKSSRCRVLKLLLTKTQSN
jgi:hypothetical protein